jgi:hypothetical protein
MQSPGTHNAISGELTVSQRFDHVTASARPLCACAGRPQARSSSLSAAMTRAMRGTFMFRITVARSRTASGVYFRRQLPDTISFHARTGHHDAARRQSNSRTNPRWHALEAAPSVFFGAVVLAPSADGARLLAHEAAAVGWLRDAFGHLKVIGFVDPALQIFEAAGIDPDVDAGCSTALQQSDKHRQHNERLADVPARPAVVRFAKGQGGSRAMKVLVVDADPRRHRPVRAR